MKEGMPWQPEAKVLHALQAETAKAQAEAQAKVHAVQAEAQAREAQARCMQCRAEARAKVHAVQAKRGGAEGEQWHRKRRPCQSREQNAWTDAGFSK
jgi:hypothetical protein